jgi:dienelactone hydrolase
MVAGIDRFLDQQRAQVAARRPTFWARDFSSVDAYAASVETHRRDLARRLGVVDSRVRFEGLEYMETTARPARLAETASLSIHRVRWPVLEGFTAEGLLLQPAGPAKGLVIALPDADQSPELLCGLLPGLAFEAQYPRLLAESGCLVVVPVLLSRDDAWSGNSSLGRFTNQPHREWIYRQAFEMGRHVIGFEVQQVMAVVDWFTELRGQSTLKVAVSGWGEGGLIALQAGALDPRVDITAVSGYFGPRDDLWAEPIYRNVWGLLERFGDAEIASLIYPRTLLVEPTEAPEVKGPPPARPGRAGAAPGRIPSPSVAQVQAELERAARLCTGGNLPPPSFHLLVPEGYPPRLPFGPAALGVLLNYLDPSITSPPAVTAAPTDLPESSLDPEGRQRRQVAQMQQVVQTLLRQSERKRQEFFWQPLLAATPEERPAVIAGFRSNLWDEVIGRWAPSQIPLRPRSRLLVARPEWTAYEIVLEIHADVFAWGVLLLPRNLQPGETRPVIVCQHGLEGLPEHTFNGPGEPGFDYYRAFAARLAEMGFVTFAPHNPYRGQDGFRVLQRKANPLGLSLFSIIIAQHDRILDWLCDQPFVDVGRIGFYGLSYGGKTAMRVPALLDRYCLSICSADFNDWITKNVTTEAPYSYLFTGEYEMPEFNLGHTFNYSEMAALIAPRPFMVERGHHDGVAPDQWVAFEYAKVRRYYAQLGVADRTAIEFFDGPHAIHGRRTYAFLRHQLGFVRPLESEPVRPQLRMWFDEDTGEMIPQTIPPEGP